MIVSNELDKLFYHASMGNKEAFDKLLEEFIEMGKKMVNKLGAFGHAHFATFCENFNEAFIMCLKGFNPADSRFEKYARAVLERCIKKVECELRKDVNNFTISLDSVSEDDRPFIETIEDKSVMPIPDNYSLDQFKQRMSSPAFKDSKNVNLRSKINCLLVQGFKREEICKALNISMGTLRYNMRLNNEDKELANLKLELK